MKHHTLRTWCWKSGAPRQKRSKGGWPVGWTERCCGRLVPAGLPDRDPACLGDQDVGLAGLSCLWRCCAPLPLLGRCAFGPWSLFPAPIRY